MSAVMIQRLGADRFSERHRWVGIRTLCCRTGDNGAPIGNEQWEFFARVWIEPYEKFLPQWTYIALHEDSLVGYLTGCPDTRKLARARAWRITLPLLAQITLGRYRHLPAAQRFWRREIGLSKSVERRFSHRLRRSIESDHPAHLHMNVDENHRRKGVGRNLIDHYLRDLRSAGVSGVHLFCGPDPVAFYRSLGFEILETAQVGGAAVFALGRKL